MSVVQAAVLGITAVVMAIQIKAVKTEYALYLVLCAAFLIALLGMSRLEQILNMLDTISEYLNIRQVYLGTLLKMVGVVYIAEFASGICKDAGYSAIGTQIEIFGKLSILAVSAPVFVALFETLQRFAA